MECVRAVPAALLLSRYPSGLPMASLAGGVAVASALSPLIGAALACGAVLALAAALPVLATDHRQTTWRLVLRATAFFLLGWIRAFSALPAEEPGVLSPRPVRVAGTVTRPPVVVERFVHGTRLEETRFTVTSANSGALDIVCRGRAPVRPGARVELTGTWLPPRPPRHPGDRPGRHPRVIVPSPLNLVSPRPAPHGWNAGLGALRGGLLSRIRALYRDDHEGLIAALILGDRRLLKPATRQVFEAAGTLHILAVSGLHVGLIMYYLLRFPIPVGVATPLRLLLLVGFSLVSGGYPPVVRAALMLGLHLGLEALGRAATPLNTLGWTATALLLWEPPLLLTPGFQLSFCGVFFLLTWGRRLTAFDSGSREAELLFLLGGGSRDGKDSRQRPLSPGRLVRKALRGGATACRASIAAWAGTTPLVAFHFLRLHPFAAVWTVLVAPLLPLILIGGILSIVCADLAPPFSRALAYLVGLLCDLLVGILDTCGRLPWSAVDVAQPTVAAVASTYIALLLGLHTRYRRAGAVCGVLVLLGLGLPDATTHRLWIFDVGSGDAMLLRSPTTGGFLIDGGTSGNERRAGGSLRRAILSTGSRSLSGAFLTHGHADHARGLVALREHLPVEQLWVPISFSDSAEGRNVLKALGAAALPVTEIGAGDRVTFDNAPLWHIEVLHPHRGERLPLRRSTNDMSLALKLSHAGHALLLLGDLEEAGLARLFASGCDLRADGLVLPHHGRWNALWRELVQRVAPRFAVISGSGSGGAYKTIGLLEQAGLSTFATWRGGGICVTWTPHGWRARYLR